MVVLPHPDGPNSAVIPRIGASNATSSSKLPSMPANRALIVAIGWTHVPGRAIRFSSTIIERMTTNENTSMPAARM